MRIEDIDKNLKPQGLPEGVELEYFDVKEAPFKVWGLMYEGDSFCRLPDAVAKATSPGVYGLHEHCAGGRVTFSTDSKHVAIVCRVRSIGKMAGLSWQTAFYSGVLPFLVPDMIKMGMAVGLAKSIKRRMGYIVDL